MKKSLLAVAAGALLAVTPAFAANTNTAAPGSNFGPAWAQKASLLNQANQLDREEISDANMLSNKAGNNIALKTLASTLRDDHQANDNAVHELANHYNINLQSHYAKNPMNNLNNLHGTTFDKKFLSKEAQDHRQALQTFEAARNQPQSPAMKEYLDETIPVLQAHLTMIENMQHDMGFTGAEKTAAK
jgi:putative membrane protein